MATKSTEPPPPAPEKVAPTPPPPADPPPPPPPAETHVAPHPVTGEQIVMAGPAPVAQAPSPVAVGTVKVKKAPSLVLPMVNNRASHFYFRRTFQILRSMGKMRY